MDTPDEHHEGSRCDLATSPYCIGVFLLNQHHTQQFLPATLDI
jgi:hypothetical protein